MTCAAELEAELHKPSLGLFGSVRKVRAGGRGGLEPGASLKTSGPAESRGLYGPCAHPRPNGFEVLKKPGKLGLWFGSEGSGPQRPEGPCGRERSLGPGGGREGGGGS